jgi:two-component system sensor histidine kinase QseC
MLTRPASLQGRLLLLVTGWSLAVWLLAAALTWRDARHEVGELLDSHLAQSAALLVAQGTGEHEDEHGIDAPSLHRYAPKVVFQVLHDGRIAISSANAPGQPMVSGDSALQGFHTVRMHGEPWRVFATSGSTPDVQVFVGERLDARDGIVWAVLRSMLWPVAIALPVLALAGWWSVRRGLEPLRALGRTLAQRAPDALAPVHVDRAPAEILPVVSALNALFGRITELLDRERRFTGDAAHELRTPIAATRTQAQVAMNAVDDVQRQRALSATLAGCDRAARLVEQLLTLSRLEAEALHTMQPLDLAAVVHRVTAELAPESLARKQILALRAQPGCIIRGDETLVAVLVRNLVDNALRYTPPGARIEIAVRTDGASGVFLVEDSGPGLKESDLARLGQRFFRPSGTEPGGSGLGWSIVQRIAQAHGAVLVADLSPDLGGLRVRVAFPMDSRAHSTSGAAPSHLERDQLPATSAL